MFRFNFEIRLFRLWRKIRKRKEKREVQEKKLIFFKLEKKRKILKKVFTVLKKMKNEALKEKRNELFARVFYKLRRLKKSFEILKNLKLINLKIIELNKKKAIRFRQRKVFELKRLCFYSFDKNLYNKMLPYKKKIHLSIKKRSFSALKNLVERKKLIMARHSKFEKWKINRIFQTLKLYKNSRKKERENYASIYSLHRKVYLTSYFTKWIQKARYRNDTRMKSWQISRKNELKLKERIFSQWNLGLRENYFKREIYSVMKVRKGFRLLKINWIRKKRIQIVERNSRKRQLSLIFKLLSLNLQRSRQSEMKVRELRERKRMKIFQIFFLGLKKNWIMANQYEEVLKISLRWKLRAWIKITKAKVFYRRKILLKFWRKFFGNSTRRRLKHNSFKEKISFDISKNKLALGFNSLKNEVKIKKFRIEKSKEKIFFILKKIHFCHFEEKSKKIKLIAESNLKRNFFRNWMKRLLSRVTDLNNRKKSLLFWYKKYLKKSFLSLKINALKETRKKTRRIDSMNQFMKRQKKIFLKEIVEKVVEHNERKMKEMMYTEAGIEIKKKKIDLGYKTLPNRLGYKRGYLKDGKEINRGKHYSKKNSTLKNLLEREEELRSKYKNPNVKKTAKRKLQHKKKKTSQEENLEDLESLLIHYRSLKKNFKDNPQSSNELERLKVRIKKLYKTLKLNS